MTDVIKWLEKRKYIYWKNCDVSSCKACYIGDRAGGWWEFNNHFIQGGYQEDIKRNLLTWLRKQARARGD